MIKFAEVKSRNLEKGTVRVIFKEDEELESYDLPVLQLSTQASKSLSLPDIGEQVAVAMDKNMVDGCVLGCLYNDTDVPVESLNFPQDGTPADSHLLLVTEGGVQIAIGKTTGNLFASCSILNLSSTGNMSIEAGEDFAFSTGGKMAIFNQSESFAPLLSELITAIRSITVPTGTGPSGTPINAAVFSDLESRFLALFTA